MDRHLGKVQRQLIDDKFRHNHQYANLSGHTLAPDDAAYISAIHRPHITHLHLASDELSPPVFQHLVTGNWYNLIELHLGYNSLGNEGCRLLSQGNWNRLICLSLNYNQIDEFGIKHLVKAQLNQLQQLDLSGNKLSQGAWQLRKGNWRQMSKLYLKNNSVNQWNLLFLIPSEWHELTALIWSTTVLRGITGKDQHILASNYFRLSPKWPAEEGEEPTQISIKQFIKYRPMGQSFGSEA